jgi:transcriptional regulator GlxA family with amidase domain
MADDSRHPPSASNRPAPAAKSQPEGALGVNAPRTVVFALYNKVTLQDVAGPLEVFARANDFGAGYRVLLASPNGEAVATTAFTKLNVDMSLAEVPDSIDTLVVPRIG